MVVTHCHVSISLWMFMFVRLQTLPPKSDPSFFPTAPDQFTGPAHTRPHLAITTMRLPNGQPSSPSKALVISASCTPDIRSYQIRTYL